MLFLITVCIKETDEEYMSPQMPTCQNFITDLKAVKCQKRTTLGEEKTSQKKSFKFGREQTCFP